MIVFACFGLNPIPFWCVAGIEFLLPPLLSTSTIFQTVGMTNRAPCTIAELHELLYPTEAVDDSSELIGNPRNSVLINTDETKIFLAMNIIPWKLFLVLQTVHLQRGHKRNDVPKPRHMKLQNSHTVCYGLHRLISIDLMVI